jgi:antitoxin (DNA-binding transcriptional repressor) of toxin-antitoxin stability system
LQILCKVAYVSRVDIEQVPPGFRPLVARYGPPVDVEDARARWAELVTAAESGTITLITRERWEWAALVPNSEVADFSADLPMWSVSTARAKLGHLVREVGRFDVKARVLTRHRRAVAALVDPAALIDRPEPAARLAAETLLEQGCRIELIFEPGQPGRVGPDGDVTEEPEERFYAANAYDNQDRVIAVGVGDTLGEALLRLTTPRVPAPEEYATEAPF